MLGLAYEVVVRDLHDREFLKRCTVGFDEFESYLMGQSDGLPKTANWASEICGVAAGDIRDLAIRMAQNRTMISVSWSLTRQAHGEEHIGRRSRWRHCLVRSGYQAVESGLGTPPNIASATTSTASLQLRLRREKR